MLHQTQDEEENAGLHSSSNANPFTAATTSSENNSFKDSRLYSRLQTILTSPTGRICFVLFLDLLAFSVVLPVLPNLILDMCNGDAARAAFLQGAAASVDGVIKFFVQPILGRLSDSVGRKPILAYSIVGSCISFSLYVVYPSIPTLFVAHALHGMTQCTFLVAMSAIADVEHDPLDSSALTHAFGLVGVALGIAFVVGPVFGGVLSLLLGNRPVYAVASLLFALTLWALRDFMRETLAPAMRREFSVSEAIPFRSSAGLFKSQRALGFLCGAYFLCAMVGGVYSLWILFTRVRYGWGPAMAGVMLSLNGIIVAIAQGLVLRWLVPDRLSEASLAQISYPAHGFLFIFVAFSTTGEAMIASLLLLGIPSALGEPSIKSVLSHLVPATEQGTLQGALGSVHTAAQVVAPLMYSSLFMYGLSKEMRMAYPAACPPGYKPPPELNSEGLDDGDECGGIPGLPFLAQALVFFIATAIMRVGFRMASQERATEYVELAAMSGPPPSSGRSANRNQNHQGEQEDSDDEDEDSERASLAGGSRSSSSKRPLIRGSSTSNGNGLATGPAFAEAASSM